MRRRRRFQRCSVYTTVYPLAVIGHARALHEKSPSALSRKLHTRAPVRRLGVLDQRELQDHYSVSRGASRSRAKSRAVLPNERLWNDPRGKADKTVAASIRLAGGCEGSHDFVDAGFKLGDRERFLKKRKRGRILTHRLIIIEAPLLCIHRDRRPVSAAMEAGRNKARRPTH
jgi:hypothetical protein